MYDKENQVRAIARERGYIVEYCNNNTVCWRYDEYNRKEFNTYDQFIAMWSKKVGSNVR